MSANPDRTRSFPERRQDVKRPLATESFIQTGLARKFLLAITALIVVVSLGWVVFFQLAGDQPGRSLLVLGFLTVSLILGVGLAVGLSRAIVHPLQRLAQAMNLVADEEDQFDALGMPTGSRFRRLDDYDLNIHTRDEIEQLADKFKAMMRKLENSCAQLEQSLKEKNRLTEDLQAVNRRNEAIIRDRTREIVEKNLRLYETTEELQFQKEDLIGANEQLEKISQMKSDFLASMSHELRTPLNSIIGFAEVLKHRMFGELNKKQDKYIGNIQDAGKHLLSLINNILDISKVEAGKMVLLIETYSINRVIDEVRNTIRTLAYKKNIEIKQELGQDMVVQGDAAKFKQILYNLLSNAIKFTEEMGKITVATQEVPAGRKFEGGPGAPAFEVSEPSLLLTIRDTGIGIPLEEQEKIFIEFEQTEQSRKSRVEGTGLGLALTRRLAILHGGAIWLSSMPGEGTTMFVVLPINAKPEKAEEEAPKNDG